MKSFKNLMKSLHKFSFEFPFLSKEIGPNIHKALSHSTGVSADDLSMHHFAGSFHRFRAFASRSIIGHHDARREHNQAQLANRAEKVEGQNGSSRCRCGVGINGHNS